MDIQFYRSAIALQFPHADLSGFRLLGEGGVFYVFETDCETVWRAPKQPIGEASLDLEIRLLPELADAVSLPIPRYEYVSYRTISPRFVSYRKIGGAPFTREQLAAGQNDRPLRQLAAFLTELHRYPVERAQAIGVPTHLSHQRRAEWMRWSKQIHQYVMPLLNARQRAWAERMLGDLLDAEVMADYIPVLTHGDLWAEHVLFDAEHQKLTGVIDWESASIGDAATDWVALLLDHGPETVERLLAHYGGPVNATLHHRMVHLASYVPLNEILCGVLYDDGASWREGWQRINDLAL